MKLVCEASAFKTARRIFFKGKHGEEGGGAVTLTIDAERITTERMTAELEHLATETAEKIKKIVAAQEAPQQFVEGSAKEAPKDPENKEDEVINLWLQYGKEYQQAADDTVPES